MSKSTTNALVGYLFMVMYYIMFLSINMGSLVVYLHAKERIYLGVQT